MLGLSVLGLVRSLGWLLCQQVSVRDLRPLRQIVTLGESDDLPGGGVTKNNVPRDLHGHRTFALRLRFAFASTGRLIESPMTSAIIGGFSLR